MIENLVKAAEVAQKAPEQSNKSGTFNPDKHMETEGKNGETKESKRYDPDERIPAEKQYFDDNGEVYRVGDRLLPNKTYEINGYKYKTDEKGRISSAEGKLQLADEDYKRNMENVRNMEGQEYKGTDDRGHLFGHQFKGSDTLANLVPMDSNLNRGEYAKFEKTLADAVKDKADVRLKVEPVYEKDSTRPSEFKASYSIDGDRETKVFRNERTEQL